MRKLLQKTLILALLSVVGINAKAVQKVIYSYNQGTESGTATATVVGTATGEKAVDKAYSSKINSNQSAVTCITFPSSITSSGAYVAALKVEGDFKAGDKITVQPFTQMSTDDFTGGAKYATVMLYDADVKKIADITGSAAGALTITDGHEEAGDPKSFDYYLEKDYTELYFGRAGGTRLNILSLTITREVAGGTAIELTTSSAAIYALNSTTPEGKLPTETGTSSATWEGTSYSFSLTGATSSEYLRDLNSTKAERQIVINETSYRPILLNKGTNGVYNITKSDNVKSVTLYAKYNATSGTAGTIIFDYGLTGQTTATTLPLLEETAAEFDVTDKTNIRVSGGTAIAFAIEYESGASVTVADINWASLYLPVAVTIPEGVKAYYASNVSSSSVTLTEITDAIPANTGVVINAEADTYSFPIATTEVAALGDGVNKFDGVAADTPCDARTAYVLSGANEAKTAPKFGLYTGTTLGAYKAYIDKEANNLGDALTLNFVIGEPTAIDSIEAATPAAQVKKYILNGAVIVEKDGKKYNTAGAQVK
ncbi:MAG: hypothetical protein IJ782_05610 [Prevotella sp.]|nr:hypothetical protein [Prevotella sp.]